MIANAKAFAKLNISLDIIAKMPDEYHEMLMVMQTVQLCDDVSISCCPGNGITVVSNYDYIPVDDRNIAAKAVKIFLEFTKIKGYEVKIELKKRIPVAAGLGGGSADGACVLRLLNSVFNTGLSLNQLEKIGAQVGSDVPFCIGGGTKLASGRGEILSDITPIPDCYIVICKPSFAYSTPELFRRIKCDKIRVRPDTEGLVSAFHKRDLAEIARRMYNVFEDFLPRGSDDIDDIKSSLLDFGALGVVMSGSGSSVFGLFGESSTAEKACDFLKKKHSFAVVTKPQHYYGGSL